MGQKVSHREEVDNSAEALSSDQLVKRFAAEKSALFGEPADSSSKPMKSPHKSPVKRDSQGAAVAGVPGSAKSSGASTLLAGASADLPPTQQGNFGLSAIAAPDTSATAQRPKKTRTAGPNVGASAGARQAGTRAKQAASITEHQKAQTLSDCVALANRFDVLHSEEAMGLWAVDCGKQLKVLEKRRAAILSLETVDAAALEFQMSADDLHTSLTTKAALIAALTAYSRRKKGGPTSKAGKASASAPPGDPLAAFKKALEEVIALPSEIPPMMRLAQFTVQIDACRANGDVAGALKLLGDPQHRASQSDETQREAIENILTDMLRKLVLIEGQEPIQEQMATSVRDNISSCIRSLQDAEWLAAPHQARS